MDAFRLDRKVAVVTGAGKGIGRGIALCLAEAGADLVLGAPEDIGHALVFMASPAADWITGQCLYVTGGL